MLQRRLTRQQVVSDADPLLDCAGRTSCVQSEEMPHAQPALHSRRAQQFAEAGLKIATDTAGVLGRSHSHWRKGEFDSGGHGSAREPMEKNASPW